MGALIFISTLLIILTINIFLFNDGDKEETFNAKSDSVLVEPLDFSDNLDTLYPSEPKIIDDSDEDFFRDERPSTSNGSEHSTYPSNITPFESDHIDDYNTIPDKKAPIVYDQIKKSLQTNDNNNEIVDENSFVDILTIPDTIYIRIDLDQKRFERKNN